MEHGKKTWLVADCYWPEVTTPGAYVSHEAICVLNTTDVDAEIKLTLYYQDQEPVTGFTTKCAARRTHHVRMDKLVDANGKHIRMGAPYAALVESNTPIICQYSRIDTTQVNETFGTTMMF